MDIDNFNTNFNSNMDSINSINDILDELNISNSFNNSSDLNNSDNSLNFTNISDKQKFNNIGLENLNNNDSNNDLNNTNYSNNNDDLDNVDNSKNNLSNINTHEQIKTNINLFTHDIDRRIGKYLLNELEKKQSYIDELEDVIKYQEKEIGELKLKLDSINKLELIAKLKTNIEQKKLLDFENLNDSPDDDFTNNYSNSNSNNIINSNSNSNDITNANAKPKPNPIVRVKKINNSNLNQETSSNEFVPSIPDLVLNSNSRQKVKSIKKEEEEPRYCGVTILEKPKSQSQKIFLDNELNSDIDNSEKSTEILKQRRRCARL